MEESVKYKKIYNILKKGGASITLDYSGWWSAYCPNNYMAQIDLCGSWPKSPVFI